MSKTHKLLLADDHRIVLDGLEFLLSADPTLQIVSTVENGQEVLDFIEKSSVDLVIMDINMPVMDGITCAKKLKDDFPEIKVIILTQYAQKTFVQEVAQIVDGCLLKSNTGKQLTAAVHQVLGDGRFFDDFEDVVPNSGELGKREIEVIRLMSEGLTSEEIAKKLHLSIHTVKTHRKNILRKTGLKSTPDLIVHAINHQLI